MFKTFLRDESGASAAEYALILAVVGSAIAAAALFLGGAVRDSVNGAANEIEDNSGFTNTAPGTPTTPPAT